MTTFTDDDKKLIKEIRERIGSLDVRDNIERRAYEISLASLEAEPIGFRCRRNDNLGDWSYVYHREPDDFERKHLVIEGIYAAPPAPVVPEGLVKAVRFYEQVKNENPPVGTGAWKDAVDWVLEEACQAVNTDIKG
ncbi:hypothetical protein EB653_23800 [Escherichia coli]|nr:hypothetical protein [Escherichia coli]